MFAEESFVSNTNAGIFMSGRDNSRTIKKLNSGNKYNFNYNTFINVTNVGNNFGIDKGNNFLKLL